MLRRACSGTGQGPPSPGQARHLRGGYSLSHHLGVAKHFTWAPCPSSFFSWALLSANATWHVLVGGHPDAGVRPMGPTHPPGPARPRPRRHLLTVPQTTLERGVATPLPVEVDTVAQEGDSATGRQGRQEAEEGADAGHPAAGIPRAERWARAPSAGSPAGRQGASARCPSRPRGFPCLAPLPADRKGNRGSQRMRVGSLASTEW